MEALRDLLTLSVAEMYNILQLTDILVLDIRAGVAYDLLHIKTALNVDVAALKAITMEAVDASLPQRLKSRWKSRAYVSKIILYGEADAHAPETSSLIASITQLLRAETVTNRLIYTLHGGLRSFSHRYSYLCLPSPPLDANGIPQEIKTKANLVYPSEILEELLYLGGALSAHNLDVLNNVGITRVIACAAEFVPPFPDKLKYLNICVDDTPATNIQQHFEATCKFIDEARAEKERVLVHCAMGISRSTTIVLAYLIRRNNMTLKTAFEYVRVRRPAINPNRGFMQQLIDLEVSIYAQPSLRLDEAGNRTWL